MIPAIQFSRDSHGRTVLNVQSSKGVELKGMGTVSGDGQIRFGSTSTTEGQKYTQFTYIHEGDEENLLILDNAEGKHYSIEGENANVSSKGGNVERTIQVDAKDSNVDLSNAEGSQVVYTTASAERNKIKMGSGNDIYVDSGKFNNADGQGGSDHFTTEGTSHGSVIKGGTGNDVFAINGSYHVVDGGEGSDHMTAAGIYGQDAEAAYRSVFIGGDGDDVMVDKGGYNMFFAGSGNDTYEVHGSNSIAYKSSLETGAMTVISQASAINPAIFGQTETFTDKQGKTYTISEIMNKYDWTLNEFLKVYSQVSGTNKDSLFSTGVVDEETMNKLSIYFANNLSKVWNT